MPDEKSPHTSEYFLARAVQCEELATQTAFAENNAILLGLAKRWRALAAESERTSFRPVSRAIGSPSPK
jgi:hypothetical protein